MINNEKNKSDPKIEVQYFGEDSFEADRVLLEFSKERRVLLVQYDDASDKMTAHFVNMAPNTDKDIRDSHHWIIEKKDFQSGNMRFKIVIGPSMWRLQRIKKQAQIIEIRGIMKKIIIDQITYEYAAPLADLIKVEIVNQ